MRTKITLTGVPLSVNHLYKRGRHGGVYMTQEGKDLKEMWMYEVMQQWKEAMITEPVAVEVIIYWPDKRKRDNDNALKLIFDCMQGRVYEDDNQIEEHNVKKFYGSKDPRVELTIVA